MAVRPTTRKRRRPTAPPVLSVTPTVRGFTPLGILVVGAILYLLVQGGVRVGVCVATTRSACTDEWTALRTDSRAAGLGLVALIAQSPFAKALQLLGLAQPLSEPPPPPPTTPAARRRRRPAAVELVESPEAPTVLVPADPKTSPTTRRSLGL